MTPPERPRRPRRKRLSQVAIRPFVDEARLICEGIRVLVKEASTPTREYAGAMGVSSRRAAEPAYIESPVAGDHEAGGGRGLGEQDLAPMGSGADAGHLMHGEVEVAPLCRTCWLR
jgi:hypothetical protein